MAAHGANGLSIAVKKNHSIDIPVNNRVVDAPETSSMFGEYGPILMFTNLADKVVPQYVG